jgi:hypothetical protein
MYAKEIVGMWKNLKLSTSFVFIKQVIKFADNGRSKRVRDWQNRISCRRISFRQLQVAYYCRANTNNIAKTFGNEYFSLSCSNSYRNNHALKYFSWNFQQKPGRSEIKPDTSSLVYADVDLRQNNINATKKNTDSLIDCNKEVGLDVNKRRLTYLLSRIVWDITPSSPGST